MLHLARSNVMVTWYRLKDNQRQLPPDFAEFHRTSAKSEAEPTFDALGNLVSKDASWEPSDHLQTLELLVANYMQKHSSPFRVLVLARRRRSAEQIANRLVLALSVNQTFPGMVWTQDDISLSARIVKLRDDPVDQRRFQSAPLDAVVLSGGEELSDLPIDRFGKRRGFVVIGGIHSQSSTMVKTMLEANSSAVYLADPVTGHTWQVGDQEPHIEVIVDCIKTLYRNPQARTRAVNLGSPQNSEIIVR
jgi:hypothetical protein